MKNVFSLLFLLPLALQAAEVSVDDAATAARAWVDRGYAMGKLPAGQIGSTRLNSSHNVISRMPSSA